MDGRQTSQTILFHASDSASWITGTVLSMNGGVTAVDRRSCIGQAILHLLGWRGVLGSALSNDITSRSRPHIKRHSSQFIRQTACENFLNHVSFDFYLVNARAIFTTSDCFRFFGDGMQHMLSLRDVMNIYGLSLTTVYEMERYGLLSPPQEGCERYYSARDCLRIEMAVKALRLGFSFAEIAQLVSDPAADRSRPIAEDVDDRPAIPSEGVDASRARVWSGPRIPARRKCAIAALFVIALAASFFLIEIVDPAPMDVMAKHCDCHMKY